MIVKRPDSTRRHAGRSQRCERFGVIIDVILDGIGCPNHSINMIGGVHPPAVGKSEIPIHGRVRAVTWTVKAGANGPRPQRRNIFHDVLLAATRPAYRGKIVPDHPEPWPKPWADRP